MENDETVPVLISYKPLKSEFHDFQKIPITTENFTLGRGLHNLVTIPFLAISRNHCFFKKVKDNEWIIEDNSTFGIKINDEKLGKGLTKKLSNGDLIILEPSEEFVYKFICDSNDVFEIPKKRRKMAESIDGNIINNVMTKFEESQKYEIKHMEEKLQNTKQMQTNSLMLKQQLQSEMNKKIQQLESDYASQIENLKGEKKEVETQKALLIEERNAQLATVKQQMESKIEELMNQLKKHNETESKLFKENSSLKEKLLKEREEFLSELSRESSSKQEVLEKLEAKIREQEEVRLKEKQELEQMLKNETEQLRLAKEQELKQLEEQTRRREIELEQELDNIKKNLQEQVEQTEQQRLKVEQLLNEHLEQMKKLSDEDKVKMEELAQERQEIQKKLYEAEINAEKSREELMERVSVRETELAALAAERIQKQQEHSSEVISTLQEQLEKVQNQLNSVESEKNILLESLGMSEPTAGTSVGTSKQTTLTAVGELMESELQCSICAELFVEAITLNCSHTFCKYCITMWKKKKKDCPICRSSITSECKSLVLDSFIEKMVQNLTNEMKKKRQEILQYRAELESELVRQTTAGTSRGSHSYDDSEIIDSDEFLEEEEEEEYEDYDYDDDDALWSFRPRFYRSDSDSGSDDGTDTSDQSPRASPGTPTTADGTSPSDSAGGTSTTTSLPDSGHRGNSNGGVPRRRGRVAGHPHAYYGGYGRCFRCGARGHWAPGCPLR